MSLSYSNQGAPPPLTYKLNYPHPFFCNSGTPVPSEAPLCSFLLETDKNCAFFSSTFMMASVEFGLGCEFPVLECKGLSCGSIIRQSTIYYAGLLERWSKRIVNQASDVPSIIFFHELNSYKNENNEF